jgi:hypothetical protein
MAGAAMALGGCAGDNTRYACAGYPSQPLCLPPSAIYGLTEGSGPAPTAEPRPSMRDDGGLRHRDDGLLDWSTGRTAAGGTP